MIISNLDYLESIPETCAMYLNGGNSIANANFSAYVYGDSTNINTIVKNLANSSFGHNNASSYVSVSFTGLNDGYSTVSSSAVSSSASPSASEDESDQNQQ